MEFRRRAKANELSRQERFWLEQKSGKHLDDKQPVYIVYDLPLDDAADQRATNHRESLLHFITKMEALPAPTTREFTSRDHDRILYDELQ